MGLLDRIRRGAYVPDDASPPPRGGPRLTLAAAAGRIAAGEGALPAVRDVLDGASQASPEELADLLAERPASTGDPRADALLAGVAEHLASTRGVACPSWTQDADRFLDRFWFVSEVPGFRAVSLAQSPVALKRRGILWPARSLERV